MCNDTAQHAIDLQRQKFPDAYYSINEPGNDAAEIARAGRRLEHELWQRVLPAEDDDFEIAVNSISAITGKPARYIENALSAHYRLAELPILAALQADTYDLDLHRLSAIDDTLCKLPLHDEEILAEIDHRLAMYLIPRRANQLLPSASQIRRKINQLITTLAGSLKEEKKEPRPPRVEFHHDVDGTSYLDAKLASEDAIEIEAAIRTHAKSQGLSWAASLKDLVLGANPARVVLNVYRAHDVPDAPAFVFGAGWQCAETSRELAGRADKVRDIDAVANKESASYAAPDDIKAYVMGRDGTCRYPGHYRRADTTQMDHRIDFEAGGPTAAKNLASLCQHDHNIKTDGRARYIMDEATGEIVWLFDDGTWRWNEPTGPLSVTSRNWVQTVGQRMAKKRAA